MGWSPAAPPWKNPCSYIAAILSKTNIMFCQDFYGFLYSPHKNSRIVYTHIDHGRILLNSHLLTIHKHFLKLLNILQAMYAFDTELVVYVPYEHNQWDILRSEFEVCIVESRGVAGSGGGDWCDRSGRQNERKINILIEIFHFLRPKFKLLNEIKGNSINGDNFLKFILCVRGSCYVYTSWTTKNLNMPLCASNATLITGTVCNKISFYQQ
jgi:hypothetical protein